MKIRILEKLFSATVLLTASQDLKFSDELTDDINEYDFLIPYNEIGQPLEDLHNFCEPVCSRTTDTCYYRTMCG